MWASGRAVLLSGCAVLVYAGTFGYGFIDYDDQSGIVHLELIRELGWARLPAFFRPDVRPGLPEYMPLKNLSYAVDYALFGLNPQAFRIQQMLWYLASVVGAWRWLHALWDELAQRGRLGFSARWVPSAALLGAILFALHPAHVESVTWLSGRKDLISGAFVFLSLGCALRYRRALDQGGSSPLSFARDGRWAALAICAQAAALLAKPTAVVLPALFLLQDLIRAPRLWPLVRARLPLYLPAALLSAGFAAFYVQVATGAADNVEPAALYTGPLALRWTQQILWFARASVWPFELTPIVPAAELATAWSSAAGLCGLALALALGVACVWWYRRRSVALLFAGTFLVPLAPIVLAPAWGQYAAGRYLFHALFGACMALAWLWGFAQERLPRPALRTLLWGAGLGVACLWAALCIDYNRAFRDGLSLWNYAASVHPQYARFHRLGAQAALLVGKPRAADAHLERCIALDPRDATCVSMFAERIASAQPERAEAMLRAALPHDSRDAAVHLALARLLARTGRAAEGVALYERWLSTRGRASPQHLTPLVGLSLLAGDDKRALAYAHDLVRAAALQYPALRPPVPLLQNVARSLRDDALSQRIARADQRCSRSDCFARELGW